MDSDTKYDLTWTAGARPPTHPNPMTRLLTFRTYNEALEFMLKQAPDAKLVSLVEVVTRKSDRTAEFRRACDFFSGVGEE